MKPRNMIQTMVWTVFFMAAVAVTAYADVSQAKVLNIKGEAKLLRSGTSDWVALTPDVMIAEGDKIKTAAASQVELECAGNAKTAELVVRESTEFAFETFRHDKGTQNETTMLDVEIGSVLVKAEKLVGDSSFEVKTPTSIVGIRGTTFEVSVARA